MLSTCAALSVLHIPAFLFGAGAPLLSVGRYIQLGGSDLAGDRFSAPTVVDWNNDGRKDLLVGEFRGYVRLFLNSGTDIAPVFTASSTIVANGSPYLASGG